MISKDGIQMDPEKVDAILNWEAPRSVPDVKAFVGFAGFYRRFIANFSARARPLTDCTKGEGYLTASGKRKVKYAPFNWTNDCQRAFDDIKSAFQGAPMLAHFDPDKETWIETDASDFVSAGMLSQVHDGVLRPVAFFSRKMSPAECNYMIYDKELLAIIRSFETWRPEATSVAPENPVKVFTDHKNLEYFMTTKQLNRRQARWAEFLSEFNFKIMYRPGKQGEKPDMLTRRSQDLPKEFDDDRKQHQFQTLLQESQLDDDIRKALNVLFCPATADLATADPTTVDPITVDNDDAVSSISTPTDLDDLVGDFEDPETAETALQAPEKNLEQQDTEATDLEALVATAYDNDRLVQDIMAAKRLGLRRLPPHILQQGVKLAMGDLEVRDHRLWVGQRLYIPEDHNLRLRIMEAHHTSPIAGHPGEKGMYRSMLRNYFWPGMKRDCQQYASNCPSCHRSRTRTVLKQGLLKPLPIPKRLWQDLSMDFITHLPPCRRRGQEFKHCLVVVDRLGKGRMYEPLANLDINTMYEAMNRRVFCTKGLPVSIVSDRGSQIVSHLWKRICDRRKIQVKLSSAQHPETDGQTEIVNKALKIYLRNFINYAQDDWVDWLPEAEFAGNNFDHSATGITPFFAEHGYHPRSGVEPPGTYGRRGRAEIEQADKIIARVKAMQEYLQNQLAWAQEDYERFANAHRQPHPEYRVGDQVYVDARHFAAERPSRSLGLKNAGPWKIIRIIDNKAYELDLPEYLKRRGLTPIFHPWKFHLAPTNPYPGQRPEPEPPILVTEAGETDPHEEWDVLEVVDCRNMVKYGTQYKATYIGDWDEWNSNPPWQPWTDFRQAINKVLDFHREHPEKPKPPKFFTDNATLERPRGSDLGGGSVRDLARTRHVTLPE
jgi:hypothetical protein